MPPPKTPDQQAKHTRDPSFHVTYRPDEIPALTKEILEGTIADVHLSLFTYWVCEATENYEEAKKHIRELGLDQGYPTSRLGNDRLRKLVDDTKHLRPTYDYGASESDEEGDSSQSSPKKQKPGPHQLQRCSSLLFPLDTLARLSGVCVMKKGPSFSPSDRLSPVVDSKVKETILTRQVSSPMRPRPASPWRAKSDALPVMAKRQYSVTNMTRSTLSSDHDYPPDTPDRPAPLNFRSRGSDSDPTTASLRSISTPIHEHPSLPFPSPAHARRRSMQMERSTSQSGEMGRESYTSNGAVEDIFSFPDGAGERGSHLFASAQRELAASRDSQLNTASQPQSFYELEPHELAESESNSPMPRSEYSFDSSLDASEPSELENSSLSQDAGSEIPNTYDGNELESFPLPPSNLNNECSTLSPERHSSIQDHHPYGQHGPAPLSLSPIPIAAPTPAQRRSAARARRAALPPNLAATNGFHRPLPLRSYESEAFLYPTARAQGHGRAASLSTSPKRGHRSLQIGNSEDMARCSGPCNFQIGTPSRTAAVDSPQRQSGTQSSQDAEVSQSRNSAGFTAPSRSGSLAAAYRSVTEAFMKESLQRTRFRGAQLRLIDWDTLSPFESAWRSVNEQLLVAIYGRADVVLTDVDVHYVDRIAQEMREGVGRITGYEWIGELFH